MPDVHVSGPSVIPPKAPKTAQTGDLFINHKSGALMYYDGGGWKPVYAEHRFPMGWMQVGDVRVSTDDLRKITEINLQEITLLMEFIRDTESDSELIQQFNLWKAQKKLENAQR